MGTRTAATNQAWRRWVHALPGFIECAPSHARCVCAAANAMLRAAQEGAGRSRYRGASQGLAFQICSERFRSAHLHKQHLQRVNVDAVIVRLLVGRLVGVAVPLALVLPVDALVPAGSRAMGQSRACSFEKRVGLRLHQCYCRPHAFACICVASRCGAGAGSLPSALREVRVGHHPRRLRPLCLSHMRCDSHRCAAPSGGQLEAIGTEVSLQYEGTGAGIQDDDSRLCALV